MPVQIELCPLAVAGLASRLTRRGYQLQGFENQLARVLPGSPVAMPEGVHVTCAAGDREAVWLQVVAEGFAVPEGEPATAVPPEPDTVERLQRVMQGFMHPEFDQLLATIDGEPAGAACAYVMNGILGVAGTATLARFRRRGVQHALIAQALQLARGRAELAMATTEPGSSSQRTFERLGFQVIYTRAIFVLT
jgi:GNAT superfamily N-acetyltransferase